MGGMASTGTAVATKAVLHDHFNYFGQGTSELHKRVFGDIEGLGCDAARRHAKVLPRDDPRRRSFLALTDFEFSCQLLIRTSIGAVRFAVRKSRSVVQTTRCAPEPLSAHCWARHHEPRQEYFAQRRCIYCHFPKTATGAKHGGIQ